MENYSRHFSHRSSASLRICSGGLAYLLTQTQTGNQECSNKGHKVSQRIERHFQRRTSAEIWPTSTWIPLREGRHDRSVQPHPPVWRNDISPNFRQQFCPSRKHKFQLVENRPIDGKRGRQFNSFYFRTNRRWNNLPSKVFQAETVNAHKNRLEGYPLHIIRVCISLRNNLVCYLKYMIIIMIIIIDEHDCFFNGWN